jgi:F0F1-type ATP synthase epsilon subunit
MREFITRFPTSVLAQNAQHRIDVLERAARERQDKEQAKLEGAKQRDIEKRLEERLARLEALSASDAEYRRPRL